MSRGIFHLQATLPARENLHSGNRDDISSAQSIKATADPVAMDMRAMAGSEFGTEGSGKDSEWKP